MDTSLEYLQQIANNGQLNAPQEVSYVQNALNNIKSLITSAYRTGRTDVGQICSNVDGAIQALNTMRTKTDNSFGGNAGYSAPHPHKLTSP